MLGCCCFVNCRWVRMLSLQILSDTMRELRVCYRMLCPKCSSRYTYLLHATYDAMMLILMLLYSYRAIYYLFRFGFHSLRVLAKRTHIRPTLYAYIYIVYPNIYLLSQNLFVLHKNCIICYLAVFESELQRG